MAIRRDSGPHRAKTGTQVRRQTANPASGAAPAGTRHAGSGAVRGGSATTHSSGAIKTTPASTGASTGTKQGPVRGNTQGGGGRGNKRSGNTAPSLGLRAKFMLVLSGVTAVAMILLGSIMATKANKYLGSQKQHDGIEVAKLAGQIITSVADRITDIEHIDKESAKDFTRYRRDLERYLHDASNWGSSIADVTDILAVKYNCPGKFNQLSSAGIGTDEESGGSPVTERFGQLFIPKSGVTIILPDNIQVLTGVRMAGGAATPIYRFKVLLDHAVFGGQQPIDQNWDGAAYVNVDINASSVNNAQSNLFTAILMGVILTIAIVIGVANWLAGNITKPIEILVRDMKSVAQGDLDHETKAHSSDEIGVLAIEFNRMTQNLKGAQSALVEQEKAEYELSIAREVQRQLLPANSPEIPGFQCASYYLGAKAVSGDYFDFIDLDDGLWGFIIADVSGKGIPGSMVMAVMRTIVRLTATKHGARASETLKETNRLIARQIKRGMFVTSFYAVLDSNNGTLTYACAGHNPMIIYRGAKRSYELAAGKGIAIGFNEGPIFDKTIELHQTVLNRGDGIVLYTDGFPEAMNVNNEEFGDEKFYALVPKYGQGEMQTLINGLVGEIAKHRGEADQSDDLTLLAVRRI